MQHMWSNASLTCVICAQSMAAELAAQLLAPWTGQPRFVAAPSDPKRAEVVKKLAQFVVKNGVNFLDLIKTKQQQNPEYTFL